MPEDGGDTEAVTWMGGVLARIEPLIKANQRLSFEPPYRLTQNQQLPARNPYHNQPSVHQKTHTRYPQRLTLAQET